MDARKLFLNSFEEPVGNLYFSRELGKFRYQKRFYIINLFFHVRPILFGPPSFTPSNFCFNGPGS